MGMSFAFAAVRYNLNSVTQSLNRTLDRSPVPKVCIKDREQIL